MSFLDIQFPPKISLNAIGGPEFLTDIVIVASGAELRNQNWSSERLRYEVSHAARREVDWRQLQAFFRIVAGRAYSFRFKDWTDYQCAAGSGSFVTSTYGSPTGNQMVKAYSFGGNTYYRPITKPINGTINLTGGGTLDYSTGVVHGGTPTAWDGEFDVHVRFDTDAMKAETINKKDDGELLVGWQSIPVVEVRE